MRKSPTRNKILKFILSISLTLTLTACDKVSPPKAQAANKQTSQTQNKTQNKTQNNLIDSPRQTQEQNIKIKSNARPTIFFGAPHFLKKSKDDDLQKIFRPLMDHLENKLNLNIKIISFQSTQDSITYLASGKIHFTILGATTYINSKQLTPEINLLATELRWNPQHTQKIDHYQGFIIALKRRPDLLTIQDLKNKTFGFVNKVSTAGFVAPNAYLHDKNIDYHEYFKETFFLGAHSRVIDALVEGSIDAGVNWTFSLNAAKEKHGDIFRKIATIGPIPNFSVVAHPNLDKDTQLKLTQILLNLKESDLTGLPAIGYVKKSDHYYNTVRKMINQHRQ